MVALPRIRTSPVHAQMCASCAVVKSKAEQTGSADLASSSHRLAGDDARQEWEEEVRRRAAQDPLPHEVRFDAARELCEVERWQSIGSDQAFVHAVRACWMATRNHSTSSCAG